MSDPYTWQSVAFDVAIIFAVTAIIITYLLRKRK